MTERHSEPADVAVVTRLFDAVSAWDLGALLRCYHPEVTIHECGELPYGGTYRGLGGAMEHARSFGAAWSTFWDRSRPVTKVVTSDGEGNVTVRFRHQAHSIASGRTLDEPEIGAVPGSRRTGRPITDVSFRAAGAVPLPQPGRTLNDDPAPATRDMSSHAVDLPPGPVAYEAGGDGPVVVLLHGVLMDSSLWRRVVPQLTRTCRVITPTLPLGAHRPPMAPQADLSMRGQVHLLADFMDALDLRDVTLVVSDWGGPLFLTAEGRDARVSRLVVTPCEAFDNFPPGLPGRAAALGPAPTCV